MTAGLPASADGSTRSMSVWLLKAGLSYISGMYLMPRDFFSPSHEAAASASAASTTVRTGRRALARSDIFTSSMGDLLVAVGIGAGLAGGGRRGGRGARPPPAAPRASTSSQRLARSQALSDSAVSPARTGRTRVKVSSVMRSFSRRVSGSGSSLQVWKASAKLVMAPNSRPVSSATTRNVCQAK